MSADKLVLIFETLLSNCSHNNVGSIFIGGKVDSMISWVFLIIYLSLLIIRF